MNDSERDVFEKFVDLGSRSAQQLGFSRSLGQIYAALYLSETPLGLKELMELLQISKGSASMGVRQLEAWGAVRSVWVRGDRRDYYEVNTNFGEVLRHLVSGVIRPRVRSAGNQLKDLQRSLEGNKADGKAATMSRRIAKLESMRKKMEKLLPILETVLK